MKKILCILVLMSLAGCSTIYKSYSQYEGSEKPVSSDLSRVFVFRDNAVFGVAVMYPVEIDKIETFYFPNATFAVFDLEPGMHTFKSKKTLYPYHSEVTMNLKGGETYYLELSNNDYGLSGVYASMGGEIKESTPKQHGEHTVLVSGAYALQIIESSNALKAIRELSLKGIYVKHGNNITKVSK